tara:strand:+ start:41393 stop:41647 length:255 start_codon:yes stop_codon:yes gene_type:complete
MSPLLKIGDLVYVPSEVRLLQFNDTIEYFNPEETYIGPSPIKMHQLKRPINLLLMETNLLDEKYIKVWYDGGEWYVDKSDVNNI